MLFGSNNALGNGSITINSGGSLYLRSTSDTGTLPNSFNLAGSGIGSNAYYGSIVNCLGFTSYCEGSGSTTLTLSGDIGLTGNSQVINGNYTPSESSPPINTATFDFTGNITYNGNTLTAVSTSSTIVNLPAVGSSIAAPNSPNSPDTGSGLTKNNPVVALLGGFLIACSLMILVAISRKHSKSTSKK